LTRPRDRQEAHDEQGEIGDGVDLLRIEGDRIAEVRLFSSDRQSENAF
jgi:hypothetical protein